MDRPDDVFVAPTEAVLRQQNATIIRLPVARWHPRPDRPDSLDRHERSLLARAGPPVLDIGCGPGRHVLELARAGRPALGIDTSRAAVTAARTAGATVIRPSVFGDVPAAGHWQTVLLLDGNLGIGGDPVTLMRRLHTLLRPDGDALVELALPAAPPNAVQVCVATPTATSGWCTGSHVPAHTVDRLAAATGFHVNATWHAPNRCVTHLRKNLTSTTP